MCLREKFVDGKRKDTVQSLYPSLPTYKQKRSGQGYTLDDQIPGNDCLIQFLPVWLLALKVTPKPYWLSQYKQWTAIKHWLYWSQRHNTVHKKLDGSAIQWRRAADWAAMFFKHYRYCIWVSVEEFCLEQEGIPSCDTAHSYTYCIYVYADLSIYAEMWNTSKKNCNLPHHLCSSTYSIYLYNWANSKPLKQ